MIQEALTAPITAKQWPPFFFVNSITPYNNNRLWGKIRVEIVQSNASKSRTAIYAYVESDRRRERAVRTRRIRAKERERLGKMSSEIRADIEQV